MCVIMYKAKGVAFPSESEIRNCVNSNRDGFSMMWNYNGKVQSFKSLSSDKFMKTYRKIARMDADETACVVHCRIKTHGTQKIANCHCWIDKTSNIGFAHNGVLDIENRDDMTDSETFFRDLFVPAYRYGGWSAGERAIKACIGLSKFAFLMGDGTIRAYGPYQENKEGAKYSNGSWKTFPTYGGTCGHHSSSLFYGIDEDEYYDLPSYYGYENRLADPEKSRIVNAAATWLRSREWYDEWWYGTWRLVSLETTLTNNWYLGWGDVITKSLAEYETRRNPALKEHAKKWQKEFDEFVETIKK